MQEQEQQERNTAIEQSIKYLMEICSQIAVDKAHPFHVRFEIVCSGFNHPQLQVMIWDENNPDDGYFAKTYNVKELQEFNNVIQKIYNERKKFLAEHVFKDRRKTIEAEINGKENELKKLKSRLAEISEEASGEE